MTDASRDIPLPIQRAVRQRCGFGCVICGFPLYEYEHMLGFANVQRHVAVEITLLCDRHHREKTSGLLPLDDVVLANRDPYNLRSGVSKPYDLHYSGSTFEVAIGGNTFSSLAVGEEGLYKALAIDAAPMVGFRRQGNHLLLHLLVFDEFNQTVLHIFDNWLRYSTIPWDIEMVGRNLIVREGQRKILIDILFDVPDRIVIQRGRFLRNGVEMVIAPDMALVTNTGAVIGGCTAKGGSVGLGLGTDMPRVGCGLLMPKIPRYPRLAHRHSLSEARKELDLLREMPGMDEVAPSVLEEQPVMRSQ